ncbi:hypothetical protein L5515_015278 [Caenorhabditis briggsae]|uniref:PAN-3 domain-containing protein n=1 Tax=Caenorhabditis briggsae TaxID=6238 RepID=A0AAE9EEA8_CAEBR|nr:hypothetical protein L5515_015278 [Caenorhabditis briggsae]
MMLVFGKVENVDLADGPDKSEKNCIDGCFSETDCVVAYMNSNGNCLYFNYNYEKKLSVTETTKSEGLKVAIKHFEWTDGYTKGNSALSSSNAALSGWDYYKTVRENCLSAARIDESSQTINDVSCDDAENQFGTVCGYQLI